MADLFHETEIFINEFDAAIETHLEWTRRILRCAVLHTSPDEDMLSSSAHELCRFGQWFRLNKDRFDEIDVEAVQHVEVVHKAMHDAIRSICVNAMNGIAGKESELKKFEESQSELLTVLAKYKTLMLSNAVRRDPLTGLPLRYGIESDFTLCRNDATRSRSLLYVVMIDIDHFKRINDHFGHPAGDAALQHLSNTLKRSLRSKEPLYRFGGEEFLWLLRCDSAEEAEQSAQRIVATISSTPVILPDVPPLVMTVTLGLALVDELDDVTSAIKRADLALYKGKHEGRNRYVIASP